MDFKHSQQRRRPPTPQTGSARTKPTVRPAPNKQKKTIEVRLHLPDLTVPEKLKKPISRVRSLRKKQKVLLGAVIIGLIITATALGLRSHQTTTATKTNLTPDNPLSQLKKGTPKYATVLPDGKSIEDLGGWTQISPPEREPVFAYVDRISDVPISVSQQPLPPTFTSDPDTKVRDLAMAQNASRTISAGSTKVYIGTSKNGPQSVIFNTDTLLILIKSSSVVSDDEWKKYIQSLS